MSIKKTTLLHESGREMILLGGDCFEQFTKGDIVHEYKWRNEEPIMLIYKRVLGANTPAYMIEMKDAHEFVMSNGHASMALLRTHCHEIAKVLRAENDKATIFRIIGIIEEGIGILLKMPPEPEAISIANRPTAGNQELSLKIGGKTVMEVQV